MTYPKPSKPLRASWIPKIEVSLLADCPVPGPCWLWHGHRNKRNGYGRVQVDGRSQYLHRVSYERLVGPIPTGLQIDHLCRQPACCAPHHLEPVTCLENVRRGTGNGSEQHCPQDHPYSGENLYVYTDRNGNTRRHCRECRRGHIRNYRRKHRDRLTALPEYLGLQYWPTDLAERATA